MSLPVIEAGQFGNQFANVIYLARCERVEDPGARHSVVRPVARKAGTACRCSVLCWWSSWRRIANRRIAARTIEDLDADSKCWERCIQALHRPGFEEDVERGGVEGLYARERHQLHPNRPILSCAVQQLQLLQEGMLLSFPGVSIISC